MGLDNAVAVLAGGPYGPGDAPGQYNRTIIMRSCRSDGVLLKADTPITVMGAAVRASFQGADLKYLWSTHSDITLEGTNVTYRWSYIVAIEVKQPMTVTVQDLLDLPPAAPAPARTVFAAYDFFQTADSGGLITNVSIVAADAPLTVAATPNRTGVNALGYSYTVVAPLLGGRWIVAEADKWVAFSRRRRAQIVSCSPPMLQFSFVAAKGEAVSWAVSASDDSRQPALVACPAAACTAGATECALTVLCSGNDACTCSE